MLKGFNQGKFGLDFEHPEAAVGLVVGVLRFTQSLLVIGYLRSPGLVSCSSCSSSLSLSLDRSVNIGPKLSGYPHHLRIYV